MEQFQIGKTRQERLQEQADKQIFLESEVTAELLDRLISAEIRRVNTASDEEYEAAIFSQYLDSLD